MSETDFESAALEQASNFLSIGQFILNKLKEFYSLVFLEVPYLHLPVNQVPRPNAGSIDEACYRIPGTQCST